MGVAAMVNTFCKSYNNCYDLPEVQEIISTYESFLGNQCIATGQDEEDHIILSLKALKTIGKQHSVENMVAEVTLHYDIEMSKNV